MSNVNSFLSIGALILLALVNLQFNSSLLENQTIETENKIYLTAFSLADDLIEEIKQKAFDAATVDFPTNDRSDLTPYQYFGSANSETYPNYNDIDDYQGFRRTVSLPHAENYVVSCDVWYMDESNPDQISSTQTFYKKVKATVTSPYLKRPVSLSFIFTLK